MTFFVRFNFDTLTLAAAAVQTLGTQGTVPVTAAAFGWAGGPGAQETFGHCRVDSFQISGVSGATPILCGPNNGQHGIHYLYHLINTTCRTLVYYILLIPFSNP